MPHKTPFVPAITGRSRGLRPGGKSAVALACAVGAFLGHRTASACSTTPPPPALVGSPSDGDVEVPTDVLPFYDSTAAEIQDLTQVEFSLTSSTGDSIGIKANATYQGTFELTPDHPLEPSTKYTLLATLAGATPSVAFTTGSGPVSSAPLPPSARLQHYQFGQPLQNDCSPWAAGTCVAVANGLPVEAVDIDQLGQDAPFRYLYTTSWFENLSGIDQGTPDVCVRLRSRAANGTFSTPVVLCGAGAPLSTIRGSEQIACTPNGITQDGALVVDPSGTTSTSSASLAPNAAESGGAIGDHAAGGCSVAAPRGPSSLVLGLVLSVAQLAGLRRWRSSSTAFS
jgi:hypothetical protein